MSVKSIRKSNFNLLRRIILIRDNYTCQLCGKKPSSQVHHIIPRKFGGNNSLDNLITLCGKCHMLISVIPTAIISKVWRMSLNEIHSERKKILNALKEKLKERQDLKGAINMQCKIFSIKLDGENQEKDLQRLNNFLQKVEVKYLFSSITGERNPHWSILVFYAKKFDSIEEKEKTDFITEHITQKIYEKLKKWCKNKSSEEKLLPYMIAHNSWLMQIAEMRITEKEELQKIKGFGKKRAEKYGDEIIQIVKSVIGKNATF